MSLEGTHDDCSCDGPQYLIKLNVRTRVVQIDSFWENDLEIFLNPLTFQFNNEIPMSNIRKP